VTSRSVIAQKYLSRWFWIDAPSSIPVELIELAMQGSKTHALAAFRVLRIVRVLRVVKLLNVGHYISSACALAPTLRWPRAAMTPAVVKSCGLELWYHDHAFARSCAACVAHGAWQSAGGAAGHEPAPTAPSRARHAGPQPAQLRTHASRSIFLRSFRAATAAPAAAANPAAAPAAPTAPAAPATATLRSPWQTQLLRLLRLPGHGHGPLALAAARCGRSRPRDAHAAPVRTPCARALFAAAVRGARARVPLVSDDALCRRRRDHVA
jgi:hypothetical protein